MLVYMCEIPRYSGPVVIHDCKYSFSLSGSIEGEYPMGVSGVLRWFYGLAGGQVGWIVTAKHLAPSMFVTGVEIEEVVLNASLSM